MDVTLRRATLEDVPSLSGIFGRAFDDYRRGLNVTADQLGAFWSLSLAARVGQTTIAAAPEGRIAGFAVTVASGAAERYGRPGIWRERLRVLRSTVRPSWFWRMPALFIPMGLAYAKRHTRPDEHYISLIAVDPDVQGRGVGQALLRAVEDEARGHGAAAVLLHTASTNTRARASYERAGYELICTVRAPWKGPAQIPAYVAMRKPLGSPPDTRADPPDPRLSASDAIRR